MNTIVQIITRTLGASTGAKNKYITDRQKSGTTQDIIVIVDNGFDTSKARLSEPQKKERVQLQKDLHIYKKRVEVATEKGKTKVAKNNQIKVDKIDKKLAKPFTKDNEKEVIDITLSLTNYIKAKDMSENGKDAFNKMVHDFIKSEFADFHIATIASHFDQKSPHTHALIQTQDQTWSDFCREKYGVENTREAYRQINHRWHDHVTKYLPEDMELDTLKKGRKYVSFMEYREHGNYWRKRDEVIDDTTESEPLAALSDFSDETNDYMATLQKLSQEEFWEYNEALQGNAELTVNEFLREKTDKSSPEEEKELKSHSQQDSDTHKSTGSKRKRRNR